MTIISYKNNYKNHKNFPPVEWVRMTDDDIEKHVYVLVYTQNNLVLANCDQLLQATSFLP